MKKRRIGTPKSHRSLYALNHHRTRFATRMLGGARRPRKPNGLALACRLLDEALRIHERMAKREPNLFGPHATQYFLETVEREKFRREIATTIRRVYGESETDGESYVTGVWTERYPEFGPHVK